MAKILAKRISVRLSMNDACTIWAMFKAQRELIGDKIRVVEKYPDSCSPEALEKLKNYHREIDERQRRFEQGISDTQLRNILRREC
jgi:hypothetical protein